MTTDIDVHLNGRLAEDVHASARELGMSPEAYIRRAVAAAVWRDAQPSEPSRDSATILRRWLSGE